MQLLQKLRDSHTLESFAREIYEIEGQAREYSRALIDFLRQSKGDVVIYSYTGYGQLPSSILFWFSITAKSQKHPLLADIEDTSLYLVPYRDDISVIIFSTGEHSKLLSGLQALRTLGVEYIAFAPEATDDRIKSIMRHYSINTVPHQDKIHASLLMTLLSFFTSSSVYRSSLSSRGQRLFDHSTEGFSCLLSSLIERYLPTLEAVGGRSRIFVTSSKFLEPASLLLAYSFRRLGVDAEYVSIDEVISRNEVTLGIFLSTEERLRRELSNKMGNRLLELLFNTDPLETGIYIALLAYTLSRLGEGEVEAEL